MEAIGAILACVAAIALGFPAGRLYAHEASWCIPIGIVVSIAGALGYMGAILVVGTFWPNAVDAHVLGLHFLLLVMVMPLFGVPAAWFGYRKSMGIGLF